jgi:formylglycine-generating enzyme required for sulfatase activity
MKSGPGIPLRALDDPQGIRHANADLLSLALIDARNRTLIWLSAFDREAEARAGQPQTPSAARADVDPPFWLAGHAGWWQEYWIARHVQRQRGEGCDPASPRLASIDPQAEAWFGPSSAANPAANPAETRAARWQLPAAAASGLRAWLAATLETTLDLLAVAEPTDAGLHFFRLAVALEDRIAEALAAAAQALQIAGTADGSPWPAPPARPERAPLWLPAQRFDLGSAPGGCVPGNERWAHEVAVPEFEIDAQALNWQRYIEFAEDGGYDEPRWWSAAGWAWVTATGRRAPRDVEQLRQGVLVQRQGRLQRVATAQPVLHVSRHEAQAWCAWAGRRLPTELEWELAAGTAASRGYVWGDVLEWTGGSARPWPGHAAVPGDLDPMPPPGTLGVLRGGSWLGHPRSRHLKARRFAEPGRDELFCGFRSCAI